MISMQICGGPLKDILSGVKRIEYRRNIPFYRKSFFESYNPRTHEYTTIDLPVRVKLINGMRTDAKRVVIEINKIDVFEDELELHISKVL